MLQRQTISLPLAQGVETKADPKQVEAGKLLELENGVFTKTRSIQKRHGNVALGRAVLGSSATVPNGIGLATYGTELLLADGSSIYSYDQSNNSWNDKGDYVPVLVKQQSVVKDTSSQTNPDGTTHASGLQAYVWQDSLVAGSIRYCIIDGATNQTVVSSTQLALNATAPRVLALNNLFAFYWIDTSSWVIKLAVIPVTNPLTAATISSLTGVGVSDDALNLGPSSTTLYDVALVQTVNQPLIALTFNNNNSGITTRIYANLSPTTQLYPQKIIASTAIVLTVFSNNTNPAYNGAGPVVLFFNIATNRLTFYAYSNQLLTITNGDLATGVAGRDQLTACSRSDSPAFVVYAHQIAGNKINQYIVNDSYAVASSNADFQADARLCGRAFKDGSSTFVAVSAYFAPVINATSGNVPSQSATFLMNEAGKLVARALLGRSSYRTGKVLPDVIKHDEYSYRLATTESLLVGENLYATQSNVVALDFTFDDPSQSVFHETIANNLHLSGGFLQMYDGVGVVEHGFHFYPRIGALSAPTSGGSLSPGTYNYTLCYEWTDNQGNVHQSAPAASRKIVVSAPNLQVIVDTSYLAFTAKVNPRPVQIALYRTLVDGDRFYRVSSLTAPDLNNSLGGSLSITDTMSDADLETRPQLYTQPLVLTSPQVVRNFPAPATNCIQLNRNRLWVVDSTSPLDIWYSKFSGVETPIAFNSGFVKQVDPRGGPITALSSIDDKLLVFKASYIFVLIGQGPTNTNENNDLSDSILVTTDCGCIDQRSIVATPVGLMFQSRKGIHLIDRSLAVQYIGSPVEAYNNEEITSAILVANTNQVRFTLRSGRTLVYDYFVGQWGTFTNQYGKDSTIWQATPILLRTDGSIWRETPGIYTDATLPIRLKLATSWFSFANLQGFQRVRRAQILGAWKSAHQLQVSVCTDFNDAVIQQAVVTPATPTYFGEGLYGAESLYGGEFQLYQWRVDLARQKTQSVKFIIEDLPAATAGEGMSLSSIAFEVGAKVGLAKTPASQIVS